MSKEKLEFEGIANQAKQLFLENKETDWAMVALNIVLCPITFFTLVVPVDDNSKAKEQPMPDEWLQSVSKLPSISKDGLEILTKALSKKGFVSVDDAVSFVKIEQQKAAEKSNEIANQQRGNTQSNGAAMLLARAEMELPGTIDRFIEGTKDIVQAASGAAAFAAQNAVWLGKGLGAVANTMKVFRGNKR